MLSPEPTRQVNCERTDAHRSRLLVRLVERGIEQPFVFDNHREMPSPHAGACNASAAAPGAENGPTELPVVGEDRRLYAQGARAIPQTLQHIVQRKRREHAGAARFVESDDHSIREGGQLLEFWCHPSSP